MNARQLAAVDKELAACGMRRTNGSGHYVTVAIDGPDGVEHHKVWATDIEGQRRANPSFSVEEGLAEAVQIVESCREGLMRSGVRSQRVDDADLHCSEASRHLRSAIKDLAAAPRQNPPLAQHMAEDSLEAIAQGLMQRLYADPSEGTAFVEVCLRAIVEGLHARSPQGEYARKTQIATDLHGAQAYLHHALMLMHR